MLLTTTTHGVSAAEVVECMIRILEDDPVTNAGTGSNLNLDGQVECDASIMDGTTLGFGSVGAVSDFKNPISVATKILQESDQGPLSLGRIPPIMLVGPGVAQWVETMVTDSSATSSLSSLEACSGLERVPRQPSADALAKAREQMSRIDTTGAGAGEEDGSIGGSLVTMEALRRHVRFQSMLKKAAAGETTMTASMTPLGTRTTPLESPTSLNDQQDTEDNLDGSQKRNRTESDESNTSGSESSIKRRQIVQDETLEIDEEDRLQDTVGAICIDAQGHVAAGVSSGGIAMKFPGRVSEAALFGAGCWAQDATEDTDGFACSLTGAGEQITKTLLARTCMETCLAVDDLSDAGYQVLERFMASPLLRGYREKYAGMIGVRVDHEALEGGGGVRAEMVFAHTTQTMGIGYMSAQDIKPTAIMSKKNPGSSKVVSTRMVRL
ncbi:taspase, threonine aspartase, 1 [Mortierella sp. 14UC]|nr:taspase, threonine aspartase, 1 [Mortierella sp. 14UC]